jgi:hypothetical protein
MNAFSAWMSYNIFGNEWHIFDDEICQLVIVSII